jgi:hypothetical protein
MGRLIWILLSRQEHYRLIYVFLEVSALQEIAYVMINVAQAKTTKEPEYMPAQV